MCYTAAERNIMSLIIGLDLGNYNSSPYVIIGMDDVTKLGGDAYRLVPPEYPFGIPADHRSYETNDR